MRRYFLCAVLGLIPWADGHAQSNVTKHQWPQVGVWSTSLIQNSSGAFKCGVLTEHQDSQDHFGATFMSQFQPTGKSIILLLLSDDQHARLAGKTWGLQADLKGLGDLTVKFVDDDGGMAGAVIDDDKWPQILAALNVSKLFYVSTKAANYTFDLRGFSDAIHQMSECETMVHDFMRAKP